MSVPVIEEDVVSADPDTVESSADLTPDDAVVRVDNPTGTTPRNIKASGATLVDGVGLTLPTDEATYYRNSNSLVYSNADGELSAIADTTINLEGGATENTSEEDLTLPVVGTGINIKEGTNARMGAATLVAGTVTVSTTEVTTVSRIFLTVQSLGTVAAAKAIAVTARTAGTSFVITSADATDTSVVAWEIKEPA